MSDAMAAPRDAGIEGAGVPRRADGLAFEFRGNGFEFFRIWIVNLLLSIVTLGIYSAWAKVRTQRYFYGNTRLAGSSFEYLADPVKILKGRVIAFACLVAYSMLGQVSVGIGLAVSLLFLLVLPWMLVRGLAFRNHNSAWRGVRFGFDGAYGGAAVAFLVWPLLGALSLGLLMPMAIHRQQRFIVDHSRFGTTRLALKVGVGPFYMLFLMLLGVGILGGLAVTLVGAELPPLLPLAMALVYLALFALFNVKLTNLTYGNLHLSANRMRSRYRLGSYLWLMVGNLLGMLLTLGLFYPWAKVRTARYAAEHISLEAGDDLEGFVAAQQKEVSSLGGEMAEMFDVGIGL